MHINRNNVDGPYAIVHFASSLVGLGIGISISLVGSLWEGLVEAQHAVQQGQILVQVVPVEGGREVGWGSNLVAKFTDRLGEVREAIAAGAEAVASSLDSLPAREGWRLDEISATFGISLTSEGGVIITKAEVGTTFEVSVKFQRTHE